MLCDGSCPRLRDASSSQIGSTGWDEPCNYSREGNLSLFECGCNSGVQRRRASAQDLSITVITEMGSEPRSLSISRQACPDALMTKLARSASFTLPEHDFPVHLPNCMVKRVERHMQRDSQPAPMKHKPDERKRGPSHRSTTHCRI